MKKMLLFGLLLLGIMFISACENFNISQVRDDKDLERSTEKIVCNEPYIRFGSSCCLDQNNNNICDRDETEITAEEEKSEDEVVVVIPPDKMEEEKVFQSTLTRIVPSTVSVGEILTVKYKADNIDPPFFFSIVDEISGGCSLSDEKTRIVTILTSPATETGAITIQATDSSGSCTFRGNYQLGSNPTIDFDTDTVIVRKSS